MFVTVMQLKQHTDTKECRWHPVSTLMDLVEARELFEHLTEDHGFEAIIVHHETVGDLAHICGPDVWEGVEIPSDEDVMANCGVEKETLQ